MSLETLPGQPRAKRFLKKIFQSDHVPHALLFSGMAGVGKSAAALQFAKLLNCKAPTDADCCDQCDSCTRMENGSHPDLLWVRADGVFIKLDQIREVRDRVRFQPFQGKWRVIVIQDAQSLKEEAGNSLLKLLEEPPGKNVFLLTTLEPQMLLQTILSRCCHVRFQPIDRESLERLLVQTYQMPTMKAHKVARLADGSLERARWLSDEDQIDHWKETLRKIEGLGNLNMLDFFPLMAQWVQKGETLEQDLECIKLWMRDVILSRFVEGHRSLLEPDEMTLRAARKVTTDVLFVLYDQIESALHHLRQNANKQLVLEGVCLAIKDGLYGKGRWNSVPKGRQSLSF